MEWEKRGMHTHTTLFSKKEAFQVTLIHSFFLMEIQLIWSLHLYVYWQ
jgi:hypothetical protein